jgi:hypothetical protein
VRSVERNLCSARKFPLPLATVTSGKQLENVSYQVVGLLPPSAANLPNHIVTAWRCGHNVTHLASLLSLQKRKQNQDRSKYIVYTIQSKFVNVFPWAPPGHFFDHGWGGACKFAYKLTLKPLTISFLFVFYWPP